MARLLEQGGRINNEALQLSFPYHCGGEQALRRFLDATADACALFPPRRGPAAATQHGTKVLTRYGLATSVGVAAAGASLHVPALLWHPSGAPAACLAPLLHGTALLPVGHHKLAYNGPTAACAVLTREDPRLYMTDGPLDTTAWLTEGLFGVRPGSAWGRAGEGWVVLGVGYSAAESEMDLCVSHEQSGDVRLADDVHMQ
ncbi:hypothetical protein STCU_00744 [Strigomonas culicis]|nr:hypothetical protein STCU_00744 [Strigomonas culicis]|eukprot:EPY36122.1 hypothetical protein STCU_00744 [Strigomonas culicis]